MAPGDLFRTEVKRRDKLMPIVFAFEGQQAFVNALDKFDRAAHQNRLLFAPA